MIIKNKRREILYVILGSALSALSIKYFLGPLSLILGGASGLAIILSQLFTIDGSTNLFYYLIFVWLINIPLLIWSYKKNNFWFTIKSLLYTLLFPFFANILPYEEILNVANNKIFATFLGSLFLGYGLVLLYLGGASGGGIDLILFYFAKKNTRIKIGMIGTVVSWIIVFSGTFLISIKFQTKWVNEKLLYSLLNLWLIGSFINYFYPRHSIVKVSITTLYIPKIVSIIKENFPYKPYSIFDFESSKKQDYKKLEIILSYFETQELLKIIQDNNIEAFTYSHKLSSVRGRFLSKY